MEPNENDKQLAREWAMRKLSNMQTLHRKEIEKALGHTDDEITAQAYRNCLIALDHIVEKKPVIWSTKELVTPQPYRNRAVDLLEKVTQKYREKDGEWENLIADIYTYLHSGK
jgi:hypothetical protein